MGRLFLPATMLFLTLSSAYAHTVFGGESFDNSWRSLLGRAERLSCEISYTKMKAVWPSDSAKQLAREALSLVDSLSPQADSANAAILICLGDYCMRDSSIAEADSFWSAAANISAKMQPPDLTLGRAIAWRLMILERDRGNYVTADSLESLALADTSTETTVANRAAHLHELAQIYTKLLRLNDNWRTHERIVNEWRENPRGDARIVVVALMDLAEGASKILFTNVQSRYVAQDSAIQLGEEALNISRHYLGARDANVGYVLNRLGDYYGRRGIESTAIKYWEEAYEINLAALPKEHIECQGSIQRIGSVAASNGEFSRAEELLTLGVELRKQTQGEWHQEVASLISSLAGLYRQMGQFARAESLFAVTLDIRRKALPANHPDIATSLNSLARVCLDQGKAADAETYWRNALTIRQIGLGSDNAATVSIMQNLAALYQYWGRHEEAEAMLNKSLYAKKQYLGENHPEIASGLLNLARLHIDLQNHLQARAEASEALGILHLHGDSLNIDALMTLADINWAEGRLDQADSLVCIVINMIERKQGTDNFRVISPLTKRAEFCRDRGDDARADSLYRKAIAVAEANEITNSTTMADLLSGYAELKQRSNGADDAQALYARAYKIALIGFQDAVQVLPELKAVRYAQQIHRLRDKYISSILSEGKPTAVAGGEAHFSRTSASIPFDVASIIFSDKAVISETVIRRRGELLRSDDRAVSQLLDSLQDASVQLSRIYLDNDSDSSFAKFDRRLRNSSARKQRLEESLAHLNYKIGTASNNLIPDMNQSQSLVNVGVPFIQYVKYVNSADDRPSYAAFVAHNEFLHAFDLGPAHLVDNLIAKYRRQMQTISELALASDSSAYQEYLENGDNLIAAVWHPLESVLPDSGKVFIIPDGAINFLAFSSLPHPSGSFLVEQFEFTYLNSVRDLETKSRNSSKRSGLLALGDPDFAANPAQRLARLHRLDSAVVASHNSRNTVTRSALTNCQIQRDSLVPLVASRGEVESAGRLWKSTHIQPATILVGDAASEENFKRLADGNEVIHLATHAYFLSNDCFTKTLEEVASANPLLLSGLLLAGATTATHDNSKLSQEDGILTSEEIAGLDLRGTKCVVLSACESGLGTVGDGEGVYGLRRAFQLAGAETIVSTLWNVPDQSTARLMYRLYKSLGDGIAAAVRSAQLAAIGELRAAGLPPHPYSWGAFIVVGK